MATFYLFNKTTTTNNFDTIKGYYDRFVVLLMHVTRSFQAGPIHSIFLQILFNLFFESKKSIITWLLIILKSFTMIKLLSLIQFYVIVEWNRNLISKNTIDFDWSHLLFNVNVTQKTCHRIFAECKERRERATSNDLEIYLWIFSFAVNSTSHIHPRWR